MGKEIKKVISLDLNLESLQQSAAKARKLLENMETAGQPPKQLLSSFEKVEQIINKIQAKTKDGMFKGTDAEYSTLLRALTSIGEEFESIQTTITKIERMDDDALSKFLSKEDIQNFNKATKALKNYEAVLNSIQEKGSSVLRDAKAKHTKAQDKLIAAKEKQTDRSSKVVEKEGVLKTSGYFAGQEKVQKAKSELSSKQEELSKAQVNEKQNRNSLAAIEADLVQLNAQIETERANLEEQFKELRNAKAAFTRIKRFYNQPDENGQQRNKEQDYGERSYKKAEERVRAAEASIQSYTDLQTQRKEQLKKKRDATTAVSLSVKEVVKLNQQVAESNTTFEEAAKTQKQLEETLKDTLQEWEEAKSSYKSVTAEVNKLTQAEEDALRVLNNAEANEDTNQKAELAAAYKALRAEAQEAGVNLRDLGVSLDYSEDSELRLIEALKQHKKALVDGIRVNENSEDSLESMGEALSHNREELEKSHAAQKEYNEQLREQEAFESKIKQFLGMAGAVELLRKSFISAFNTIKELDATMGEMAVVTDLTVGDYWDQLPEYADRATDLGVSIRSAYEAATLYYQQGLKTNEVIAISTETLKMARIAGLSAEDATQKMTAALRGFNMELNETSAKNISDVYSELAAITAADVEQISNAMSKTASIASSAGMEFETTAAFLAQIIETTQESAETAGTAMKTVIARFQELKKDPAEIGEVDGEVVDANAIETALRSVGVSLRDTNGQFRELDDVFLELSSKWKGLDKNTQRYIATIAAGSRQQSRFIAMMSDYGRTQELVAAANNSAGASNKQFEKTMETLEAKLEKLKNAWDEFTMGILNSDLVKVGVDILTKFLEIVNKATSGFKGLGGSIIKVLSIVSLFKLGQKIFDKFKQPLVKFFSDLTKDLYNAGYEGAKAYMEGGEKAKKENEKKEAPQSPQPEDSGEEKKPSFMEIVKDKTGITQLQKFSSFKKQEKEFLKIDGEQIQKNYSDKQAAVNEKKASLDEKRAILDEKRGALTKATEDSNNYKGVSRKRNYKKVLEKRRKKASEDFEKANKNVQTAETDYATAETELKAAEEELEKYNKIQTEVTEASAKQWETVGEGLQKAGSAVAALGVGVSMFGGLLSSIGLEEAGEAVTVFGNGLMFVGGAIGIIGTLIPIVAQAAVSAGISVQAAWLWLFAIVAVLALITAGVIALINYIKDNTPEKKLEKVHEAAEAAADGAERAAEAFSDLSNGLDDLGDKYDNLDGLIRGTKEWNKAVQETNASVLDLINKYPELAGLVENEGGVLTLDVNSAEVQDVLKAHQADSIKAQGAAIGAKIELAQANAEYDLDKMDTEVFEDFISADKKSHARLAAFGNLTTATALGIGSGVLAGAGIGAAIGSKVGTVAGAAAGAAGAGIAAVPGAAAGAAVGTGAGAGLGAAIGTVVGGVSGLVTGIAQFERTVEQIEKSNEQDRENIKNLAQAYAKGETGTSLEEVTKYIEREGMAQGKAAEQMANALLNNTETLLEFGNTLNAVDEQQKAYYQAMALNAQQMLNLGSLNEAQQAQINTVFDEDLMKDFQEAEKERLTKEIDDSNSEEFKKEQEKFAKSIYGENARVDGNKILNEKGEVVREFQNDDEWVKQMAAAAATEKAADAMMKIPEALQSATKDLGPNIQKAILKAFEGKSLTQDETNKMKDSLGKATYKDAEGNTATSWEDLSPEEQNVWENSKEKYLKSLDADYDGVTEMWNNMSASEKMAYGWSGDSTDTAGLEKAREAFEATFIEAIETNEQAFFEANNAAKRLGISFSTQLDAAAAQGWTKSLETIASGASEGEVAAVNDSLTELLKGLTDEQVSLVMAEINAMDKMDISAWQNLGDVFDKLNLDVEAEALQKFANAGIAAYNAIEKINFKTLADDINSIYQTINKVNEGSRKFSEEDYKGIVEANKELEDSFRKVGKEFYYVGGTMEDLIKALEKNTLAKLDEANRQLKSRGEMATIIQKAMDEGEYGTIESMGRMDLSTYLTNMRQDFAKENLDIADFGIAGLTGATDFSNENITEEQLREWALAIRTEGGKAELYNKDYQEGVKNANIERYTHNEASYNAEMAVSGGDYKEQHQEALIAQAIESGAVTNSQIDAYKEAIKSGQDDLIRSLGKDIAEATEKVVKSNEGRDALGELISQVEEALINTQQKAIDKLTDINDSVNNANEKLISSLQEQISINRQKDELAQSEEDLNNLYAQQTYLNADSSGANLLESMALGQDIREAEKSLEETYIDQAIQQLEDANAKAAEQRERQITLMENQLQQQIDNGDFYREATSIVRDSLDSIENGTTLNGTKMYEVLFGDSGKNLSGLASEDWATNLSNMATQAQNWLELQGVPKDNKTGSGDSKDKEPVSLVKTQSEETAANALTAAKVALTTSTYGGYAAQEHDPNSELLKAYEQYKQAGNENTSLMEFAQTAVGEDNNIHEHDFEVVGTAYTDRAWSNDFNWEDAKGKADQGWIHVDNTDYNSKIEGTSDPARTVAVARGIANNTVFKYADGYYIYHDNLAYKLTQVKQNGNWIAPQFKTGGLADFTGPAWLDGTKAHPEMVLNARDTQNFIQLKDILAEILEDTGHSTSGPQNKQSTIGTIDIDINVENLSDDYDVEQLADKIRSMLYEDAMYRNVNNISISH